MSFLQSLRRDCMEAGNSRRRPPAFMLGTEVRSALSDRFGPVKVSSGGSGTEYLTSCPWCGRKYKLSVNPSKGVFHCWHCGESGRIGKLMGKEVKVLNVSSEPEISPEREFSWPSDESDLVPLVSLSENNSAIAYVRGRGFDPVRLWKENGVMYCGRGKWMGGNAFYTGNTLVFPVRENGKLVGWQCRLLFDPKSADEAFLKSMGYSSRPPKYFTMPGFRKSDYLYNVDSARNSGVVVVTEGVFDCLRVGMPGVATFGKKVSDRQAGMLMSMWSTIALLLDPDAREEQDSLMMRLTRTGGPRIVPVELKGYKDAGECPQKELEAQIAEAVGL